MTAACPLTSLRFLSTEGQCRRAIQKFGGDFIFYAYDSLHLRLRSRRRPREMPRAAWGSELRPASQESKRRPKSSDPLDAHAGKRRGRSFDLHREKCEWQPEIEVESARKQANPRLTQRRITSFVSRGVGQCSPTLKYVTCTRSISSPKSSISLESPSSSFSLPSCAPSQSRRFLSAALPSRVCDEPGLDAPLAGPRR